MRSSVSARNRYYRILISYSLLESYFAFYITQLNRVVFAVEIDSTHNTTIYRVSVSDKVNYISVLRNCSPREKKLFLNIIHCYKQSLHLCPNIC